MLRRQLIKDKKIPESFGHRRVMSFMINLRMNYNLKLLEDLTQEKHEWSDELFNIFLEPFGDGGQWVMFTNVANKYGLIPKDSYPEVCMAMMLV